AVISWGTTARQRWVTGTLATIHGLVQGAALEAPATVVVGDVVALATGPCESASHARRGRPRPQGRLQGVGDLTGRRVLLVHGANPLDANDPQRRALERRGAEVIVAPVVATRPSRS